MLFITSQSTTVRWTVVMDRGSPIPPLPHHLPPLPPPRHPAPSPLAPLESVSRTPSKETGKGAFPRAKFLCHISHALQSLLTDFCGIITVNLYSRTDTDEKWINNNYNFGINGCRACNLWQRKFGRVLEP